MRSSLAIRLLVLMTLGALALVGCSGDSQTLVSAPGPSLEESVASQSGNQPLSACWGQATKVFARLGMMGKHASEQENPRDGLRNLARELADMGVIPDDSMASLGRFVSELYGLDIEACMD